ncbi:MAG: thiolase family protein, partial [Alphaproteobacteria bacterium]|nr:thiolase family protein [Alphaproteobacteria bacterium]
MRKVSIIGTGMMRFMKRDTVNMVDFAWPVVRSAIVEAGVDPKSIGAAYCGSAASGSMPGQRVLKRLGLTGMPISNVEGACSSSAIALRHAALAVATGECDIALAFGVDQLNLAGKTLVHGTEDWDFANGLAMPGLYAMRAQRYMHEYGVTIEQLTKIAVKSKKYGALNPWAHFQQEVTAERVMNARMVADPFTVLHCCPRSDGASAVVVCASDIAHRYSSRPVQIVASIQRSGKMMTGFRDMTMPESTQRAARELYEQSGLGPEDIDVCEVHDAFTVNELLYSDALGFSKPGEAVKLLEDGDFDIGGRIPLNITGGLVSRGHPIGPTGIAQVVEMTYQLQGRAGKRQVEGA